MFEYVDSDYVRELFKLHTKDISDDILLGIEHQHAYKEEEE